MQPSGSLPRCSHFMSHPRTRGLRHDAALYDYADGADAEVADEILSADMISHGPGSPPEIGAEPIKRQAALLRDAFPDFTVALSDQFARGARVCSRWSSTGTHTSKLPLLTGPLPATGNRIAFDEIRIDRYSDGKIVESWFMPDRFRLVQRAGAHSRSVGFGPTSAWRPRSEINVARPTG